MVGYVVASRKAGSSRPTGPGRDAADPRHGRSRRTGAGWDRGAVQGWPYRRFAGDSSSPFRPDSSSGGKQALCSAQPSGRRDGRGRCPLVTNYPASWPTGRSWRQLASSEMLMPMMLMTTQGADGACLLPPSSEPEITNVHLVMGRRDLRADRRASATCSAAGNTHADIPRILAVQERPAQNRELV